MKKREIFTQHTFSGARIFSCWKIPRTRTAVLASLRKTYASQNFGREELRGFTLIETLVAISLLSVAIVAPMTLVSQSLSSAYYARDQVAAYNLAQEAIEAVRSIRDGNILQNALTSSNTDLLAGIPIGQEFTIDARKTTAAEAITVCPLNACPSLKTDGTFYGYESVWSNTRFTRVIKVSYAGPSSINGGRDEIRVEAKVTWITRGGQTRQFTMYENMFRWVEDGAAQ